MSADPWLCAWLPLIRERGRNAPALELGCGFGEDTAVLVGNGLSVTALDLCAKAIAAATQRVPEARFHCRDLREPFPVAANSCGIVIASLSLHYFPWPETETLITRIHDTLRPNGLLLCRLNSTRDHHFGASGHPLIDENYYSVHGQAKRFFDQQSIERLFGQGWHILSREEKCIDKYEKPKVLWEIVLEKAPIESPSTYA